MPAAPAGSPSAAAARCPGMCPASGGDPPDRRVRHRGRAGDLQLPRARRQGSARRRCGSAPHDAIVTAVGDAARGDQHTVTRSPRSIIAVERRARSSWSIAAVDRRGRSASRSNSAAIVRRSARSGSVERRASLRIAAAPLLANTTARRAHAGASGAATSVTRDRDRAGAAACLAVNQVSHPPRGPIRTPCGLAQRNDWSVCGSCESSSCMRDEAPVGSTWSLCTARPIVAASFCGVGFGLRDGLKRCLRGMAGERATFMHTRPGFSSTKRRAHRR
jgi:hypothetical protein